MDFTAVKLIQLFSFRLFHVGVTLLDDQDNWFFLPMKDRRITVVALPTGNILFTNQHWLWDDYQSDGDWSTLATIEVATYTKRFWTTVVEALQTFVRSGTYGLPTLHETPPELVVAMAFSQLTPEQAAACRLLEEERQDATPPAQKRAKPLAVGKQTSGTSGRTASRRPKLHHICMSCWKLKNGERLPLRSRLNDKPGEAMPCCYCGRATTAGIRLPDTQVPAFCTHLDSNSQKIVANDETTAS